LVESQALATSLLNAGAGSRCESQGSNVQFGDGQETVVVGHGANHGNGLVLVGLLRRGSRDFADDTRDGHGRAVDAGHKQALEHDLVEVGVGSACSRIQWSVKLYLLAVFFSLIFLHCRKHNSLLGLGHR
jgi:hypothetical protein